MKHRWSAAAAILALCASLPSHALPPTHSYVEAQYLKGELGPTPSVDTEGVRTALSISLQRWLNFIGEYEYHNQHNADADLRIGSAGFGLHSLRTNFQLIGAVTYEWADINTPFGDSRDEGYGVLVGVRVPLFDRFEVQADYKYLDYGKDSSGARDDDSRLRATGLMHLTDGLSLSASYQTYDEGELDGFTVGFRMHFTTQYDRIRSLGD